jgi:hypothetical protein
MSRIHVLGAVGVVALSAILAPQLPAAADVAAKAKPHLNVNYQVKGTSTVAKTGSTLKLGPATLTTKLFPDLTITGDLQLPPTQSKFKALGLAPVVATVNFVPKGKVKGAITRVHKRNVVTSTAKDYLKLTDVTVLGVDQGVGDSCQTTDPVTLTLKTPDGKSFDVNKGGVVTGTFSIGQFAGCGTNPITEAVNDALINQLVPGDGNTATLHLSDPKVVK